MNETKKLSGPAKDRFFKRFFTEAGGLDETTANRLTESSKQVFSSVRIRKNAEYLTPDSPGTSPPTAPADHAAPAPKAPTSSDKTGVPSPDAPATMMAATEAVPVPDEPAKPKPRKPDKQFSLNATTQADPFIFGLIPVYKREGAEGLLIKLAEIRSIEHLRAMAKAQQIVLARELRTGDIDVVTLRAAILEAVEKRVADRRAV